MTGKGRGFVVGEQPRGLHLGYRLRLGASFGLNIEGVRRERAYANAAPEHRITLQGSRPSTVPAASSTHT